MAGGHHPPAPYTALLFSAIIHPLGPPEHPPLHPLPLNMINVTPGAQDGRKNRPREDDFDEEEYTSRISELEKALKKARWEKDKYKEKQK